MHENRLEATRYLNLDRLKERKKEALRVGRLTVAKRERRCPARGSAPFLARVVLRANRSGRWWPAGTRRVGALAIWQQHPISPCLAVTEVMRRQLPAIARQRRDPGGRSSHSGHAISLYIRSERRRVRQQQSQQGPRLRG